MKTLYESLFDIDDNIDKLDWDKIDLISVFNAKSKEEFMMMCDILDKRIQTEEKPSKCIALINIYKHRSGSAIEVSRNGKKLWHNIYWDDKSNKVVRLRIPSYIHGDCWEMPKSLIPSFKEYEKIYG